MLRFSGATIITTSNKITDTLVIPNKVPLTNKIHTAHINLKLYKWPENKYTREIIKSDNLT